MAERIAETKVRHRMLPYLLAPAGARGELSLMLWPVMGVNARRWYEQAGDAEKPL